MENIAQEAPAPVEVHQAAEPSVTEPSQAQPNGATEAKPESEFVSKLEFNKAKEAERKLQKQLRGLQETLSQSQEGIKFYKALQQDPVKMQKVAQILFEEEQKAQANGEDPYAAYDPDVAERFRKLDALEKWKENLEKKEQERGQQSIQDNRNSLDKHFDKKLISEGILKADGTGDTQTAAMLGKLTLATLVEIAKDPYKPTADELDEAYDQVLSNLPPSWKQTIKKTQAPNVPASGSRSGIPAVKGGKQSKEDRIADIVNALG